jgi:hypothetical protein
MTIAEIRERVQKGERIQSLALNAVNLEGLADALALMPELNALAISNRELPELPPTITHCQKLGQLFISSAGLVRLPENLGDCRGLHSITLLHNKLRRLPASLSECLNLRALRLEFNPLSEFPNWAVQLPWIRTISFKNNRLISVPDVPWTCRMLADLDLSNNWIAVLPGNVSLSNLEILRLRCNQLTELPECWLRSPKLKILDIARNPIRSLPALPNTLQHLDISGCPIAGLPDQFFELTELRTFRSSWPDGKKLPAFMAACRRHWVPLEQRRALFDAFCGRTEALSALSREQCLSALSLALPNLRIAVLKHLKAGNALTGHPLPGAKMVLIGKFSEPLKVLKSRLEGVGIELVAAPKADWVLLGRPPYRLPEQLSPVFSILTEDDLSSLKSEASAPPKDALQTARLRELLLHSDETNVELALLMLKNLRVSGLHTELLCARTRCRTPRLKRRLSEQLRAITPLEELHVLKLPFPAWMKKPPPQAAAQMERQLAGTSFNGALLFQWLSAPR